MKEKQKPFIDQQACAGCSVCIENCPMDCLQLEGPKYHGDIHTIAYLADEKLCTGCGTCARVCPIYAITMKGGSHNG